MHLISFSVMGSLIIVFLAFGCQYLSNPIELGEDNIIEEVVEDVIEAKLDIKIDFTPDSDEN